MTDSAMKLNPQDLKKIASLTLEHYNQRAEEFWDGTRNHNVSQNIEALLQRMGTMPPFRIIDFGCGPGRDLKVFAEQGHRAIGLVWSIKDSITRRGPIVFTSKTWAQES
jgi:hypothetical protein